MSLSTRRDIISLIVIMTEKEQQDVLAYAQAVYARREKQCVQNVQTRRRMSKDSVVE